MKNKKSMSKIKATVGAAIIPLALAMPLTAKSAAPTVKNQLSVVSNHQDNAALKAKMDIRQQIVKEALNAAKATQTALLALNHNQPKQALAALQVVSGNLHLLLARDPSLAMLPVDIRVQVIEGITDLKTIKALEDELDDLIDDDYYQAARPIVDSLVDEIRVTTVYLPLATYPNAIDAIAPLIDAGKINEAKQALFDVLDTFVSEEKITPLAIIRAEDELSAAFQIEHKSDLSKQVTKDKISDLVFAAYQNIKVAEALGYGTKDDYEDLYDSMDALKEAIGESGFKGEWSKVKKSLGSFKNKVIHSH